METNLIKVEDLPTFDIAEHLNTPEDIAEYMELVLEDNDTELLLSFLGDVARAKGMTQIAAETGLSRESLYKSLKKGSNPRWYTVQKVCAALGVRLAVKPSAPVPEYTADHQS